MVVDKLIRLEEDADCPCNDEDEEGDEGMWTELEDGVADDMDTDELIIGSYTWASTRESVA